MTDTFAQILETVHSAAGIPRAIDAVLVLHHPMRMHDDCGHQPHEANPDGSIPNGMVELEGIGLVCEAGYQYSICRECCTGPDGYQSELCAAQHDHHGTQVQIGLTAGGAFVGDYRGACWPCPTVRAIAGALGVEQ